MRYFTHYWRRDTYEAAQTRVEGTGDRRLRYVADDRFRKSGVARGDVVYPISFFDQELHLVGRLVVDRIADASEAQRHVGNSTIWDAADYLLGQDEDSLHFDSSVRDDDLERIEFVTTGPPARNSTGEVDKQTFRGVREITQHTAQLLDGWLGLDSPRSTRVEAPSLAVDTEFDEFVALEGTPVEHRHLERERDPRLREAKVREALARGTLSCEVCAIDFAESYGPMGEGFMHVHHRLPLSESGPVQVELGDLALVCPNCHAMLHRDRSETVESLQTRVEARRGSRP